MSAVSDRLDSFMRTLREVQFWFNTLAFVVFFIVALRWARRGERLREAGYLLRLTLLEPVCVSTAFFVPACYALITGHRLLGWLLPLPVATVLAALGIYTAVRWRRRNKVSKPRFARYVLYCLAFWIFYSFPGVSADAALAALGFAYLLLLAALIIMMRPQLD